MVGLRWWNDVAEDGTSTWRYEAIDDQTQVSRPDYVIFWYSMYLTGLLWGILGFLALISLSVEWLMVCGVCFTLVWSNIYGFWNCSSEGARVKQNMQNALAQGASAAINAGIVSSFTRNASAPRAPETV